MTKAVWSLVCGFFSLLFGLSTVSATGTISDTPEGIVVVPLIPHMALALTGLLAVSAFVLSYLALKNELAEGHVATKRTLSVSGAVMAALGSFVSFGFLMVRVL
ncbi:hypothetical protein AB6713_16750 [Luteimonas sp. B3_2_R+30]|uniref:Dolichyl-diphosphooligosaccharide-protein glycosyltransferase subunit OST5 n=2 Tax=Luteimonas salinilitoris TaxID=3237697 RepID=A0ABV4HU41_9GAMM